MNRCVGCGKAVARRAGPIRVADVPGGRCWRCFFRRIARRHLGTPGRWRECLALFKAQGGRCAYTGEALVLGETASLDHRTPKARGGGFEPDNFQWVTVRVNEAKRAMTHAEFVTMCCRVAECCAPRPDSSR